MESVPFGKRLKAATDKKMFWGSPNSGEVKTLPAGKPSPVIDSYILQSGGFYQLGPVKDYQFDPSGGFNLGGSESYKERYLYLEDTPDLEVVDPDAPDQSSIFNTFWNWFGDGIENGVKQAEDNAGYLNEGFKEATAEFGAGALSFGKDIRAVLIVGVGLLVLVVIAIITNKIT